MNNYLSKFNFKNFFQGFFDKDPEKIEPSPRRGWTIILLSFVLLSFVFVGFYYFIFLSSRSDMSRLSELNNADVSIENISKTKLQKTLSPWIEKENKFNALFESRPSFDFLR